MPRLAPSPPTPASPPNPSQLQDKNETVFVGPPGKGMRDTTVELLLLNMQMSTRDAARNLEPSAFQTNESTGAEAPKVRDTLLPSHAHKTTLPSAFAINNSLLFLGETESAVTGLGRESFAFANFAAGMQYGAMPGGVAPPSKIRTSPSSVPRKATLASRAAATQTTPKRRARTWPCTPADGPCRLPFRKSHHTATHGDGVCPNLPAVCAAPAAPRARTKPGLGNRRCSTWQGAQGCRRQNSDSGPNKRTWPSCVHTPMSCASGSQARDLGARESRPSRLPWLSATWVDASFGTPISCCCC
mmetsp:Transcript_4147/g.15483  ORF Transcript_4147/g.15483 Transcript_4147/m.15483 type:complete len:301 (-) Transcript_4147:138-1040(-)